MSDDKLEEAIFARQKAWAERILKIVLGLVAIVILVSLYISLQM